MTAEGQPRRDVMAVVVTHQPSDDLKHHLCALREQVDLLVVIDNGSTNRALVAHATHSSGCQLIQNPVNLGVAAALSQAARLAQGGGFAWLATFDQDSLILPKTIEGLLALYERHPQRQMIGVMALGHRDRATGRDYHHRLDILVETPEWRSVRSTITSGSLVRVSLFEQIGLFDDGLFIDAVDHEFCLRMRKRGWLVIEGKNYVLEHSIGTATEHRLFGLRFVCTHHSAVRRYYMTRNQLEVCARNLFVDPVWAGKGMMQFAAGSVTALLYERDRLPKLRAMLSGVADFAMRRFGPKR